MPPLARYGIGSLQQVAIDHETAADTGAKNYTEYSRSTLACTIGGFG